MLVTPNAGVLCEEQLILAPCRALGSFVLVMYLPRVDEIYISVSLSWFRFGDAPYIGARLRLIASSVFCPCL